LHRRLCTLSFGAQPLEVLCLDPDVWIDHIDLLAQILKGKRDRAVRTAHRCIELEAAPVALLSYKLDQLFHIVILCDDFNNVKILIIRSGSFWMRKLGKTTRDVLKKSPAQPAKFDFLREGGNWFRIIDERSSKFLGDKI